MPKQKTSVAGIAKSAVLGGYFATTTTLQAVYVVQTAVTVGLLAGKITIPTAISILTYTPSALAMAPIVGATMPIIYHAATWAVSASPKTSQQQVQDQTKYQADDKKILLDGELSEEDVVVISKAGL